MLASRAVGSEREVREEREELDEYAPHTGRIEGATRLTTMGASALVIQGKRRSSSNVDRVDDTRICKHGGPAMGFGDLVWRDPSERN